jgi:hypothetical protein
LSGFQKCTISENHDPIERQTRFRAIPINEFVYCVAIPTAGIGAGETIEDCGLGEFEIRQA